MKEIYSFTVSKKSVVKQEKQTEQGILVQDIETEIPVKIVLKRPSRVEQEESQMIYSAELSRCVKLGLLTKAMVSKMYNDNGGILSEQQSKDYDAARNELVDKLIIFRNITTNAENLSEEERQTKLAEVRAELQLVQDKINAYEDIARDVFDNTADVKARNKQLFWWILHLVYIEENDNLPCLFGSGSYEQRCQIYDNITDKDDPFYKQVINEAILLISLWYFQKAETKEEFDHFFEEMRATSKPNDKETETPSEVPQEQVQSN